MKPISNSIKNRRLFALTLATLAGVTPAISHSVEDFLPEEKAYYLCAGCHGPDTGAVLYPMPHDIPAIIGQKKEYLLKQLTAYRDGHREHPNMNGVLGNYTDQNLADLAAYYEGLGPKRPSEPKVVKSPVAPVTGATSAPAAPSEKAPLPKKKGKSRKGRPTSAPTTP